MATQDITFADKSTGGILLATDVNSIKSVVNNNSSELSTLQTTVANIDTSGISTNATAIGTLQTNVGTLDTELDDLATTVQSNSAINWNYDDADVSSFLNGSLNNHIIPAANATYDIGSAEKKIRHLYLSDNSIYMGDDNTPIRLNSDKKLVVNDVVVGGAPLVSTVENLPIASADGTMALVTDGLQDNPVLSYFHKGKWFRSTDNSEITNQTVDIFLIAGQSNAHGWADVANGLSTDQATQDGIFYTSWHNSTSNASDTQYYSDWATSLVAGDTRGDNNSPTLGGSSSFGPELGFVSRGNAINISNNKPIGIIKYAVGASALTDDPNDETGGPSDWDLTATGYRRGDALRGFKLAVDDAIAKLTSAGYSYRLAGMVWWQQMAPTVTDTTNLMTHIRDWLDTQGYLDMQASQFPIVITKNGHGTDLTPVADVDAYIGIVDAATYGHTGSQNHVGASADGSSDTTGTGTNDMFEIGEAYADQMQLAIAGNTNSSWSPESITTRLWLDMDDETTIASSGGIVTQIDDKSGNNYDFVPSTGSNATITAISSGQNGKNILRFDGNSDATSYRSVEFSSTAVHKWYFITKVTASDAQDALFTFSKASPTLQIILFNMSGVDTFSGDWYFRYGTDNGPHLTGNSSNLLDQWVMLSIELDTTNTRASAFLNTVAYNTNVSQPGLATMGTANVRINDNNNTGNQIADSDWGEIVCVEDVTQTNSDKIEGYLAHKWGLTADLPSAHPYKSVAP